MMGYKVLYRKWRPKLFSQVCGQEHIINTLKNELKTNSLAHAFIFSGTRGTGKTTVAKILSRAVNCLNLSDGEPCNNCEACKIIISSTTTDVIEIDAASNNRVDNIREILDEVSYHPILLKNKVYIIDEVHMLSSGAFNALLKTLEEPPIGVFFILATTEPNKIPVTIQSRCQRFDFHRVLTNVLADHIQQICKIEKININQDAINTIANLGNGSVRDALSLLEKIKNHSCIGYERIIDENTTYKILGIPNDDSIKQLFNLLLEGDIAKIAQYVNQIYQSGIEVTEILNQMLKYCRDLMISKQFQEFSLDTLLKFTDILYETVSFSRYNDNTLYLIETTLIKMSNILPNQQSNKKQIASHCIDEVTKIENSSNKHFEVLRGDRWQDIISQIGVLDASLKNKILTSTAVEYKNEVYIDVSDSFRDEIAKNSDKIDLLKNIFRKDVIIISTEELKTKIDSENLWTKSKSDSKLSEITSKRDQLSGKMHVH